METIDEYTDDMYNKLYDETLDVYEEGKMKSLYIEEEYGYLRGE